MSITLTPPVRETARSPEVGTVAYEAARLDRLFPGWADRVDSSILNMGCCEHCVLGQVYGDYESGYVVVAEDRNRLGQRDWGVYGLYSDEVHKDDWVEEIERRR